MRICMIGLGSIGQRHIKNLALVLTNRNISFQIDALRSRKTALPEDIKFLLSSEYYDPNELPDDYDIIFITNPTSLHYETINQIIDKTKHVFIEKPVFDHLGYNIKAIPFKDQSVYYVACPLRYTSVVNWLKEYVSENKVYAARVICSSYLPDWRPGIDYRKIYSARKELGGGVSIDLIHEWDYLIYLFGEPKQVMNFNGTYSDLEIDSDDLSIYLGCYDDKLLSLHLDYFARYARRDIELYTKEDVIIGDLMNSQVEFLKAKTKIKFQDNDQDCYIYELMSFLDMIEGVIRNHNDVNTALTTLRIAKGEFK